MISPIFGSRVPTFIERDAAGAGVDKGASMGDNEGQSTSGALFLVKSARSADFTGYQMVKFLLGPNCVLLRVLCRVRALADG